MRYIRKLIVLILSLIFCAAVVIGVGIILAVKNVNVEFIKHSADGSDDFVMAEYEASKKNFDKLKGTNLLFLNDEDILNGVKDGDYVYVVSYEKVFPCTVNIVLKERVESFARQTADGYEIYDETGVLLRKSKTNINLADDSPNVLIMAEEDKVEKVAEICGYFTNKFSSIRNLVESVKVEKGLVEHTDTLTFNFYSGIQIIIADYTVLPEEKIKAAYIEYEALSESELLKGTIRVVDKNGDVSSVQAVYFR